MSYEKLHFIINPTSGGGNAGKIWGQARSYIETTLGNFSFEFTGQKGHAAELAKRASGKTEKIIAIGGDGTISEIVTGILQSGTNFTSIGVLNLGTGGDFCRTLGIKSNLNKGLDYLKNGKPTLLDVGRISFISNQNVVEERFFINIAGCGMAGEVVRTINKSKKLFGSFSYYISSVRNLLSYKNKEILLYLDENPIPIEYKIVTVAIANGKYFGGGMQIAPDASINDGKFHVTVIGDWNLLEKILYSSRLYGNKFTGSPGVKTYEAKKIKIEPKDKNSTVYIDSDGEDIGIIPMTIEIIPRAIHFLV